MKKRITPLPLKHILLITALTVAVSGCSLFSSKPDVPPPPRNETKVILFKCDNFINRGMVLPVEVIFITANDHLKQVTSIGPDAWFESKEREKWPFKQTLSLRSNDEILLELKKPPETTFIVVFATFYQVVDQKAQQVILDPNAAQKEVVWVSAKALYH